MPLRQRVRRYLPVLLVVSAGTLLAVAAHAATNDLGLAQSNPGFATTDIRTLIGNIIRAFLGLVGIVMVGLMVYAGFLWMTAAGQPEKIEKAKKTMVSAVIGLLIILASYSIVLFIARMLGLGNGSGSGSVGDCPSGGCVTSACTGLSCSGSGNAFRVLGYMPAGAGPNAGGWPHDLPIKIVFNSQVDAASLDLATNATVVTVAQCNSRTGDFVNADCGAPLTIKLEVAGDTAVIHAVDGKGEVTTFAADKWYRVRVLSSAFGGPKSAGGQGLQCAPETNPLDSTLNLAGYCARAVAFNDQTDSQAPTVSLDAPTSYPSMCQAATRPTGVRAVAKDDWLVGAVTYLLDGGTAALVPAAAPAKDSNVDSISPTFISEAFGINPALLSEGKHTLTASAVDLQDRASNVSSVDLNVVPGHCCNAVKDGDETGTDCGGICGKCDGDACAANADCASGFCDPTTNRCSQRAIIQSVGPMTAGPGSMVTINGQHFGITPGTVVFLGAANTPDDDVVAQACANAAWKDGQIVVQVPDGAKTGPIEVRPTTGQADRTDDTYGPSLGSFTVNADRLPGICYLDTSSGPSGSTFTIHGSGFGASSEQSSVYFGSYSNLPVATGGWSDQVITTTVPAAPSGDYAVLLNAAPASPGVAKQSNESYFNIPESPASTAPRVAEVIPESGPPGTYVTVRGSGFGSRPNVVKFTYGSGTATNIAYGAETVCGVNWHDDYIVVKVPESYGTANEPAGSILGQPHAVIVETAAPAKTSNDTVKFTVTSGTPGPGLCAIEPDNGPPGTLVELKGERFDAGGSAVVRGVDFTKSTDQNRCLLNVSQSCPTRGAECTGSQGSCVKEPMRQSAALCQQWTATSVITSVPGLVSQKGTWPASGPVAVVAGGRSDNTVPFRVQDCNQGGLCRPGETCCGSGACVTDAKACLAVARASSYGLLMSTEVVPELPQVVERPYCSTSGASVVMESPSPFRGQQDACIGGAIYFEFTRGLDDAAEPIIGSDVIVEECAPAATGDQPSTSCQAVAWNTTPFSWSACGAGKPGKCGLHLNPVMGASKWYRVRLVSNPKEKLGLHEPTSAGGRYLDGDANRTEGGDYVYTFKTRSLDVPCTVTGTIVNPQNAIIRSPTVASPFMLELLSGCNVLQCTPSTALPFSISWTQSPLSPSYLGLSVNPTSGESPCLKPVSGALETPGGSPSLLYGSTSGSPSITSQSSVAVKYIDPRVIRVAPINGCQGACANSAVYAQFNVAMDASTLKSDNIVLKKCRNASCLPPLLDVPCTAPLALHGDDDVIKATDSGVSQVQFNCGTKAADGSYNLDAGSYYVARISNEVRSLTSSQLTGLNYGTYYQWMFRTKDEPNHICKIDSVTLSPATSVLHYVGERAGFQTIARAKKDECSDAGQELNAWSNSWQWSVDRSKNPVVGGFVTDAREPSLDVFLNTNPTKIQPFCSGACLNAGSSVPAHVCGDGRPDSQRLKLGDGDTAGPEGCDIGLNQENKDWCSATCTLLGKTIEEGCGNGEVNDGEDCDKDTATGTWPAGCMVPDAQTRGCVWLGSEETKKALHGDSACGTANGGNCCGDGILEDGEQCDDGNPYDGDGCSAVCLFEGSHPSCGATPTVGCVNVCGNGVTEPGEDAGCDVSDGRTPSQHGCNPMTCKHLGTPACETNAQASCCGNGIVDDGEDADCEDATRLDRSIYCTDRCLLKGSSFNYQQGSFCGDQVQSSQIADGAATGRGEVAQCEATQADQLIDPVQYVQAEPQATFDTKTEAGITTRVTATTVGVAADRVGKADVKLQCDCRANRSTQADQDAYCSTYGVDKAVTLGCGSDSCCRPRPTVRLSDETSAPICRNGAIMLTFDQPMDQASLVQAVEVGIDSGVAYTADAATDASSPCGGAENRFAASTGAPATWWGRLWHGFVAMVRSFVGLPAQASGGPASGIHWFCRVKAAVSATYGQHDAGVTIYSTTVLINQAKAYPADADVHVRVSAVAKSIWGVPLGAAWTADIHTQKGMCQLASVEVTPSSLLINNVADPDYPVRALGRAARRSTTEPGSIIVPVEEYGWTWDWQAEALTSPIVVSPRRLAATGAQLDAARVHARNPKLGDSPSDFVPKNATDDVKVTARPLASGGTIESALTGSSDVYVMPCDNPWPKMYECTDLARNSSGSRVMPWGQPVTCTAGGIWVPFQTSKTFGLSTYYCRDDQSSDAKASLQRAPVLPAIREIPASVTPGRDILGEFLFTYDERLSGAGAWMSDAIGWRINVNRNHGGLMPWYRSKGFTGTPKAMTISGYDALMDGRSSYLSFAYMENSDWKPVYTNVATFTYNDGASAATKEVFSQMTANLTVNTDWSESRTCQTGAAKPGLPAGTSLRCATDQDCWADSNGTVLAQRKSKYFCDQAVGFCAVKCASDADCRLKPEATTEDATYADRWCDQGIVTGGACRQGAGGRSVIPPLAHELDAGLAVSCDNDLACRAAKGTYDENRDGYTCDAVKAKLARDTKRWADLLSMRSYLIESLNSTGSVPRLSSGSFLAGSTNSTWSSWQEYLYPAVGGALATDPLNKHARCAGADKYDATTCWNKDTQKYVCPADSHVYQYQSLSGKDFVLSADFESPADAQWQGGNCPEIPSDGCIANPDCAVNNDNRCVYQVGNIVIGHLNERPNVCSGSVVGVGSACGDGVQSATEECELGQIEQQPCCAATGSDGSNFTDGACKPNSGKRTGTVSWTCSDCSWKIGKKCQIGSCGDGKIQTGETCDDGSLNGKYGYCNAACTGFSGRCGDGKTQPGEACDCGVKNGQYSFNAVMSQSLDTSNGAACVPSSYANVASCSWDCQSAAPRCGDGVVNGSETCDGGYQEFKGYCADAAQTGCNSDRDCPSGLACQTSVCPQPEQTVHRACLGNNPAWAGSESDDQTACTWGSWQCSEPGTCGDGKVQSGEQCDTGNANMGNDTPCLKTGSIMCKKNICGDGFVNRAGGEECDTGAHNGRPLTTPEYGSIENYCTTACKLATVTGGFCGDHILQTATSTPRGPEKCEAGLPSSYVCVNLSDKQLCAAGGISSTLGACNAKCEPGCSDPNAKSCLNDPIYDPTTGALTNRHDNDALYDQCDPDDDNDGVPDNLDCEKFNATVHPANPACGVAAAQEVCDGVDNDCDGQIDNVIEIKGLVKDARTKAPLPGGKLQLTCTDDGTNRPIGNVVETDSNGIFYDKVIVAGGCANAAMTPVLDQEGQVCLDTTDKVAFPVKYCELIDLTQDKDAYIGIYRPGTANNPSMVTSYIEWGESPTDLDFHVKATTGSTTREVYYNNKNSGEMSLDVDDQSSYGPETISYSSWLANTTYSIYVDDWSWGAQGWGDNKASFHMFDTQCNPRKITQPAGLTTRTWNVANITVGADASTYTFK